jgi:hypothetical protein
LSQLAAPGSEQLPQLCIKEQQRVSQDDSGIGVGTSLEVLAGLAATTPSPTLPLEANPAPAAGQTKEEEEAATVTSGLIS